MNFNFNIDFENEISSESYLKTKEKVRFDVVLGAKSLSRLDLPGDNESIRMISYAGGFSSCSVVLWIADNTDISDMYVTTLRVGKKEIMHMERLYNNGQLGNATFILSGISKQNKIRGKNYQYDKFFEETCERCGFKYVYEKNHSKVILLNTELGKIVIETSSNFNENPKIEQFCVTKSDLIYDFYKNALFRT